MRGQGHKPAGNAPDMEVVDLLTPARRPMRRARRRRRCGRAPLPSAQPPTCRSRTTRSTPRAARSGSMRRDRPRSTETPDQRAGGNRLDAAQRVGQHVQPRRPDVQAAVLAAAQQPQAREVHQQTRRRQPPTSRALRTAEGRDRRSIASTRIDTAIPTSVAPLTSAARISAR